MAPFSLDRIAASGNELEELHVDHEVIRTITTDPNTNVGSLGR
jgi:hypothetical protein